MDWLFNHWDHLQKTIRAWRPSSSATSFLNSPLQKPEQINDHVYQVHKPAGRPSVEIVFFHGLQLEGSEEAYLTTWLSAEGTELWLAWILKDFEDARILLVSYDASAQTKDEQGLLDLYQTCENLVHCLTEEKANVGGDGCPVVLVGHSIGCLVIKELCVTLHSTINKHSPHNRKEPVQNLLQNVKGLFYYACPHHGSRLADNSADFQKGSLFEAITTLNKEAQRRNEDFRQLRLKYGWKTFGIGEGRPTTLGQFKDYIVPEGSARSDVDEFYTCDANHFDVCRPKCTSSSNFVHLANFIRSVLQQDQDRHSSRMFIAKGIFGLEGRVSDIMQKLNKGARRLGIVGMGGIGKTTLAEAVYDTISRSFEYTCFLRDVKTSMAKKDNLEDLQKRIRKGLYYKGCKVKDTFNWKTLKEKKVLIVLDDVEHEPQVHMMLESGGFPEESCVIVTSRESGFLRAENFEIYFLGQLEREDSKRIFCLNAFRKDVVEPGYEYRMEQFLKRCEGLPLALRVAGKYLYGKERRVWDDGLAKLKHAKPLNGSKEDGLWSILRVCYESLAEEEQEMFLDVATCFHNQDLETVKRAWSVCPWASPDAGLRNLVDKGLVTIEGNNLPRQGPTIRMHEVLRDLGRRIACPNIENVATHTRLCYDLSNPQLTTQLFNEGNPQVKVMVIDRFEDINIQSLRRLEELRVLWLEDVNLRGPLNLLPTKLAYLRMTDSRLFNLVEGAHSSFTEASAQRKKKRKISRQHSALKQLEIDDCILSEGFLDSLGKCQALEHLELRSICNWAALPESLGQLGALKHLRVASCDQLESLPHSLGDLVSLKYLVIQDCQRIRVVPDSLGRLQGLEHLEVSCGCSKAPPRIVRQLRALRHFETTLCQDSEDLLDWLGQLKSLQKVVIHGCIDHGFPSPRHQLDFLDSLTRRNLLQDVGQVDLPMFYDLTDVHIIAWNSDLLPTNFIGVGHVRNLLIKDCRNLKALPNTLGTFQVLEDLKIVNCGSLQALPETIGELKALKRLSIISCGSLESLPDTIGNLQALTDLQISYGSLKATSSNLQQLKALRRLEITWCQYGDWKALLGNLEQLHALQTLVIRNSRIDGPSATEQLDFLESLEKKGLLQGAGQVDLPIFHAEDVRIIACKLERLPSDLFRLGCASSLLIRDCRNLRFLPDTLEELQALHKFEIESCTHLKSLPDALGKLQALKCLYIEDCSSLEALPDSLGELRALRQFTIKSCGRLKWLPYALGKLGKLEYLRIEGCDSLEALPDSLGELRALRDLMMKSCKHLESLPAALGKLKALEYLCIEDCNSLDALPHSLGKLPALEKLVVQQCEGLRDLPENLGDLRALRQLEIKSCGHLKSLPDALGKLEALVKLDIDDCDSLEALPNSLGELRALQRLFVQCCEGLRVLPDSLGKLQALRQLRIMKCNGLRTLPDSLGELKTLETLAIVSCAHLGPQERNVLCLKL